MKRTIVSLLVVILIAALCGGLIWFNYFREEMIAQYFANFPVPTVTVSTIVATPQQWTPGIDAVGTVSALQGVDVAAEVSGVVTSIAVKANDEVTKGSLLVQLDDSVERATHLAVQSTVSVANDTLDRAKQLFEKNFATAADLQAAQNRFDLATGELNRVEAILAQKAIRAPFAGTVGIPQVDVGQYLQAGAVIVTLQNLTRMRVEFSVPEQQMRQLELGQEVSIGASEDELDLRGTIVGINPKVDPSSRLVAVEALVDNADMSLRPGQFVRVRVHLPTEENVIALPQTAVIISLYGSYVYQVVEAPPAEPPPAGASATGEAVAATPPTAGPQDRVPAVPTLIAKQIFVETGRRSGDLIEVIKGVEAGMQIVTSGQNKLSNGSRVVVDNSVNPSGAPITAATVSP